MVYRPYSKRDYRSVLALDDLNSDDKRFSHAVSLGTPYRPLYVKIKLTWVCNLRCAMCNVWRQGRENRLTLPVIQALADELAALGTSKVHLSGGEVLTRTDIFEVVKSFSSRGMQVNLTSNGTLLSPETADRLVQSGVNNVSISLDGATPAVHDALRGKGNWKRTLRGIRNLRRAAKHARRKLHIRINYVLTRRNYRDLFRLPETAAQAGADRLTLIPVDDPAGRLRLNKQRIREYNEEIAPFVAHKALTQGMIEHVDEAYPFGRQKAEVELSKAGLYARGLYERQPCYMPWIHAMIGPKGEVYPCCMMRTTRALGKISAKRSFQTVWEGTAFRDFRQRLRQHDHRPLSCHRCDDFLQENRFLHDLLGGHNAPGSNP
jgi:radical SAM protein with 4Fe4S-binding SPASM domain